MPLYHSDDESEPVSANQKVLRNRTIAFNETDPDLRAQIDTSVWPTRAKGANLSISKEKTVESENMEEQEYVAMSDRGMDDERRSQERELVDMRMAISQLQEERELERRDSRAEVHRLRTALESAETSLKSQRAEESFAEWQKRHRAEAACAEAELPPVSRPNYTIDEALKALSARPSEVTVVATASPLTSVSLPAAPETNATTSVQRLIEQTTRGKLSTVSDSVIAPPPFTGKRCVDAESWLEVFERYCTHRHLSPEDRTTLFPLMMRDSAADWVSTLPVTAFETYDLLRETFERNYFNPAELAWQLQGSLWKQEQKSDERVEDFVMRIRKGARRLNMEPTAICDVILNGLSPSIRMHVLLQKGAGTNLQLEDLIKYARLAEAVVVAPPDNSSNLLLEVVKASVAANGEQAQQLKKLTDQVMSLTTEQERSINMIQSSATGNGAQQRFFKPSPQRQQREEWGKNAANRTSENSEQSFREPNAEQSGGKFACSRCGRKHSRGTCGAVGVTCYACGGANHYSRVCRAAKRNASTQ